MASTRALLYAETCDFLKETRVVPDSLGPIAKRIAGVEEAAAMWLLALHPYNFSAKTARLTIQSQLDPDAEEPAADLAGWTFRYNKPATPRVHFLSKTGRERDRVTSGWEDVGGFILTNYNPLWVRFCDPAFATSAKIGYWPQTFLTAVASLIGDRLTGPVSNSRGWESDMSARSAGLIEESRLWDAGQSPAPERRGGSWNRARRGFGRFDNRRP